MTQRILHPRLQQLAALMLTGIVLGIFIASLLSPVVNALATRDQAQIRLDHLRERMATPSTAARYQMDQLLGLQADGAAAQIVLQTTLARAAQNAGLQIESTRPLAEEDLGPIGRIAWIEGVGSADLLALTDFLKALDAERPVLLVRRLEVVRGFDLRGDASLRIRLEIGQAWKSQDNSEAPS